MEHMCQHSCIHAFLSFFFKNQLTDSKMWQQDLSKTTKSEHTSTLPLVLFIVVVFIFIEACSFY